MITKITKGQSCTPEWSECSKGVITAIKLLPEIQKYDGKLNIKNQQLVENFVFDILQYKAPFSTKAIRWGFTDKPVVRQKYRRNKKTQRRNFKIQETVLIMSTEIPYIGASPDTLVSCDCCALWVVELEVTWTHREKSFPECEPTNGTCLEQTQGKKCRWSLA